LKLQAANSGPPTPLPNTQPNIYNGMFSDKVLSWIVSTHGIFSSSATGGLLKRTEIFPQNALANFLKTKKTFFSKARKYMYQNRENVFSKPRKCFLKTEKMYFSKPENVISQNQKRFFSKPISCKTHTFVPRGHGKSFEKHRFRACENVFSQNKSLHGRPPAGMQLAKSRRPQPVLPIPKSHPNLSAWQCAWELTTCTGP
jgi:hypothetical protein